MPRGDNADAASSAATVAATGSIRPEGQSFTWRGVLAGLGVGLVICFSNMYFGLQTGWIGTMSMPSSLMGFAIFRALGPLLRRSLPFSAVENVLVQTVAGSMAIMPLGCGFVGIVPAINYLLKPEENGPIQLPLWKLITWALGLCYFGVVFAVPLRKQVIIREQLKFPTGFSTAVLISVLHGHSNVAKGIKSSAIGGGSAKDSELHAFGSLARKKDNDDSLRSAEEDAPLLAEPSSSRHHVTADAFDDATAEAGNVRPRAEQRRVEDWRADVRILLICFSISGSLTLLTYFIPDLRNLPIFGNTAAITWLWTLNPSLAYVGQGIIMGPATTAHMLLGAVVGWGVLSPLAKFRGWAPGPVGDWEKGSKGWIVWVSLAVMLADAIISLANIAYREIRDPVAEAVKAFWRRLALSNRHLGKRRRRRRRVFSGDAEDDGDDGDRLLAEREGSFSRSSSTSSSSSSSSFNAAEDDELEDAAKASLLPAQRDAPASQQIGARTVTFGLLASIVFCIATIHIVFGNLVPLYATVASVAMALPLSVMGVRALGETDLNPVSGISKLTQLCFALIVPQSNRSSVLINLIAGAVSEAGALQAGDMMQDLKTGHLLGAAPKAQFWGQVIGGTAGAVVSALIYVLYTSIYTIPGDLFQVPTGYVWIFTARLVTGKGLPPMAKEWAVGFGAVFTIITITRIWGAGKRWHSYVPGGIAFAVGMYNVPSFTLARAIGGIISWYWIRQQQKDDIKLIVTASGFILGEGFLSIVNLILQSLEVPHFQSSTATS